MRSRLLAGAVALALAVGGLVLAASPASAHCRDHGTHPNLYHAGGIYWANGTAIRYEPHIACDRHGLGYPGDGINVHCAVYTGALWLFVHDKRTGISGWSRWDSLRHPRDTYLIPDCVQSAASHLAA